MSLLFSLVSIAILSNHPESGFPASGQFSATRDGSRPLGNAVAIAPNWVLGCRHTTGTGFFYAGGKGYKIVRRVPNPNADLALYEVAGKITQFAPPAFRDFAKQVRGKTATLVGFGEDGQRFEWGWDGRQRTQNVKRSATNALDAQEVFRFGGMASNCVVYDLDNPDGKSKGPLGGPGSRSEGGLSGDDSGCAWYLKVGEEQQVAAIGVYIMAPPDQKEFRAFAWGAKGYGVFLTPYRSWIQKTMKGM